jgi:hypothetical protein
MQDCKIISLNSTEPIETELCVTERGKELEMELDVFFPSHEEFVRNYKLREY